MSAAVTPEALAADPMKSVIAVARPLVPAVALIMLVPIMPPMDMEIWLTPFLPSMTPSEASRISSSEATACRPFASAELISLVTPVRRRATAEVLVETEVPAAA